jgi:hypothetical protein
MRKGRLNGGRGSRMGGSERTPLGRSAARAVACSNPGPVQRRWTSPDSRATVRRACGPRRMPRRTPRAEPANTRTASVGISCGAPSNEGVVPHTHYRCSVTVLTTPIGGNFAGAHDVGDAVFSKDRFPTNVGTRTTNLPLHGSNIRLAYARINSQPVVLRAAAQHGNRLCSDVRPTSAAGDTRQLPNGVHARAPRSARSTAGLVSRRSA